MDSLSFEGGKLSFDFIPVDEVEVINLIQVKGTQEQKRRISGD